ncbi:hypothetical protein GCM10009661_44470 [Catellatospora chokoriensis]|uniref:Uncharacterized protein n=1 Tax=Catellatospora chokoriensis TaxID=310353 RepID=A0A8J3JW35_9ACTN|nr:hypothetical protein Cch02nite_55800 [Catellatospora chokoriensis]
MDKGLYQWEYFFSGNVTSRFGLLREIRLGKGNYTWEDCTLRSAAGPTHHDYYVQSVLTWDGNPDSPAVTSTYWNVSQVATWFPAEVTWGTKLVRQSWFTS